MNNKGHGGPVLTLPLAILLILLGGPIGALVKYPIVSVPVVALAVECLIKFPKIRKFAGWTFIIYGAIVSIAFVCVLAGVGM